MTFRNQGICDEVFAYLLKTGEQTYQQVCDGMLHRTRGNLSGALSTLVRYNRIVTSGDKKNQTYTVRPRTEEKSTGLKKYVPPIKPLLGSGLTSNWELCQRAPFDPAKDVGRLIR